MCAKRHAQAAGRTKWDETDYNAACAEYNRLLDIIQEAEDREWFEVQELAIQGGKA